MGSFLVKSSSIFIEGVRAKLFTFSCLLGGQKEQKGNKTKGKNLHGLALYQGKPTFY